MLSENHQEKAALAHLGFEEELVTSETLTEESNEGNSYESPAFWMGIFSDFIF